MSLSKIKSFLRTLAPMIGFGLILISTAAGQSLRSGGYFCGTDGSCQWYKPGDPDWLFQRYTYAMGYADCAGDIQTWRSKSPGCILTLYTTGTDMPAYKSYTSNSYLFGKKSTYIRDRLVELGDIEENAYMHFYDDTRIRGWNGNSWDTLLIPGTYSMTITDGDSASRVPNSYVSYLFHSGVTYNSDARLSPNFANANLRQAYKEFITQAFNEQMQQHWPGATGTWDGLYFDNYSPYAMVAGNPVSGGHIVETGFNPNDLLILGSEAYRLWTWEWMKVFGREVRDTLHQADQWAVDGKKKFLCYNVGLSHADDYLEPEVSGADALNFEFAFDPVYSNNESYYRLENIHSRDSIATLNGVTFFWTSRPRTSYGNGYTSKRRAIYNNLCFYYLAKTDSTWLFMRPEPGNAYGIFLNPGFDTLAWIPAMEYDLGDPIGHYQLAAAGSSPDQAGATYKIWVREYERGKVYLRPRDGFDARWGDPSTPIVLELDGAYRALQPDGGLGETTTSISMHGAEGAILTREGGSDFTASPRSGRAPLTVAFTAESSESVSEWHWDFGDGAFSHEQNPQHTYTEIGTFSVKLIALHDSGADTISKGNLIEVWQPPQARFTAAPTEGQGPLVVSFFDQSEGNPNSWYWDFGDGNSSSERNPNHTYSIPGIYSVRLTVSDSHDSDDTTAANLIQVQMDNSEVHLAHALADIAFAGSVSGSCVNTVVSDNHYQVISEVLAGEHPVKAYSYLDHRWRFEIMAGGKILFYVEAYRPNNSDGDDFVFEYSADNVNFTPITTVNTASEQTFWGEIPNSATGTLFIRVVDTERKPRGTSCDAIYIDRMCIQSSGDPPQPKIISVAAIEVSRTGGKANKYQGLALVSVQDELGEPVAAAAVWGRFSGPSNDRVSEMTAGDGTATLLSAQVKGAVDQWCFSLDSISSALDIHDPTRDLENVDCESGHAIAEKVGLDFQLDQNRPNPFNPITTISFSLPEPGQVELEIFNILGQRIRVLVDGYYAAGDHQVSWDGTTGSGTPATSGIYIYELRSADMVASRKMLLVK